MLHFFFFFDISSYVSQTVLELTKDDLELLPAPPKGRDYATPGLLIFNVFYAATDLGLIYMAKNCPTWFPTFGIAW